MELKRDDIIKALEHCKTTTPEDCIECPYRNKGNSLYVGCVNTLVKDTLSLIKELTEENENLHASCTELERKCVSLNDGNERLKLEYAGFEAGAKDVVSFVKADTVRKYREKLYRELASLGVKDKFNKEFFLTKADQIAKEMLEGL